MPVIRPYVQKSARTFWTAATKVVKSGSLGGGTAIASAAGDWPVPGALYFRPAILAAAHTAGFAAVYLSVFAIHFNGAMPPAAWEAACATLPIVLTVKLIAVLATGVHRGWLRHATFPDLASLAKAVTAGSAGLALVRFVSPAALPVPGSVMLMDWAGSLLCFCAARGGSRFMHEHVRLKEPEAKYRRVLVVHANGEGEGILRMIRTSPRLRMRVVGFLDPDPASRGRVLSGLPVLGTPADLRAAAARSRAEVVLVPDQAVGAETLRELLSAGAAVGVKVQVVPGIEGLLEQPQRVRPREVAVQDILGRQPVQLDTHSLDAFLRGRVVLVTGACGSIGSEICRQALPFQPAQLVLLDHNENGVFYLERDLERMRGKCELIPCIASVVDVGRLDTIFALYRPEVVLHAAAYKHVPMMEANPGEAVKNNVLGTHKLVDASLRAGVKAFVMVSTDKAVNPTSVMGACKRVAEMIVQSYSGITDTRLVTVRFGNVLGSAGSVVPIFRDQIRDGGPVTVTHPEINRFFMTIPEAAQLVLQSGALGTGGEIFVLDMGQPVRLVDLARDMIRLSGLEEGRDIEIEFTGLRPGEKLYEELYDEAEVRTRTPHPKIFRARSRPCPAAGLWEGLSRLAHSADRSPHDLVRCLMEIVPEYRPNRPPAPESATNSRATTGDTAEILSRFSPATAVGSFTDR